MYMYMKKSEFWGAMIMFALHVLLFPTLLGILVAFRPGLLSESQINLVYYCTSAVLTFVLLGKFLRRNFDSLLDNLWGSLVAFVVGWGIYFVLALAFGLLIKALGIGEDNPNNSAIEEMLEQDRGIIIAMTVFLAPIVEECIFRGGLFCGLYRKNRYLAYVVSIVLFSVYHVWQYALAAQDISYLLYAISYIPASFALCWTYERSGSIWTSIFFHMSFNAYALTVTF